MSGEVDDAAKPFEAEVPRQRRRWSPPRVILSQLRGTQHQAGKTGLDKLTFNPDSATVSGSVGS